MKIPTKTAVVNDWAALWEHIKDGGVITADDMTTNGYATFKMWVRTHKSLNLIACADLKGGYQLKAGALVGSRKITPKGVNDWPALFAEISQGKTVPMELTLSQQTAFRTFAKHNGYSVSLRANGTGFNVRLGAAV